MVTQPPRTPQAQPLSNSFGHGPAHCLGWIVIEFGRLEYVVKLAVKNLVGQGFQKGLKEAEKQYRISAIVDDAITRLQGRTMAGPLKRQSIACLRRILRLIDERNHFVHSTWTGIGVGRVALIRTKLTTVRPRAPRRNFKRLTQRPIYRNLSQMEALLAATRAALRELQALRQQW